MNAEKFAAIAKSVAEPGIPGVEVVAALEDQETGEVLCLLVSPHPVRYSLQTCDVIGYGMNASEYRAAEVIWGEPWASGMDHESAWARLAQEITG